MPTDAEAAARVTAKEDEFAEIAEDFERREFSDDELDAIRKTRRTAPR